MKTHSMIAVVVAVAVLVLAAAVPVAVAAGRSTGTKAAQVNAPKKKRHMTILHLILADKSLSTTAKAIKLAGLTGELSTTGPLTVFAPDNQAWSALPSSERSALFSDKSSMDKLIKNLVIPKNVDLSTTKKGTTFTAQGGMTYVATGSDKSITVEFTYPKPGSFRARIEQTSVASPSGRLYMIDEVPWELPILDLQTVISADSNLSTDFSAFQFAGLTGDLSAAGLYTVFAATNVGWGKLPPSTSSTLFSNQSMMANVINYQIVPGKISLKSITNGEVLKTLEGSSITFGVGSKGAITINGVAIGTPISASNGEVIPLDQVLIPAA